MAGTIEDDDDDDMILLIVGDEIISEKDPLAIQTPSPVSIKEEPLEEYDCKTAVDDIIQTATKHGKYIEIKKERDYEFLDEGFSTDFVPVVLEDDIKSEAEEEDYFPKCNANSRNMQLNLTEPLKFSFVNQLRNKFPEMRNDPVLLVEHLASIMRDLRPPTPPANFCSEIKEGNYITFVCSCCKAKNDSASSAIRHYQTKHGKRYLTCYACGDDFRSTTNLYKHEKRCSAEDAATVLRARGHFLGRRGRARPFLTEHKFVTGRPRPRPQPTLNRRVKPTAKRRPNPNVDKQRYYCVKCPASFVQIQNLIGHENSHYGIRPYRCDSCPAAYTSEVALKRHLQKHGDKKFVCDHCGREFKLKPLLISHLDTHRPVRKLACPHCPRRFAQKPALQHHLNRDHLNLPPVCACPICPKRYARMSHVKDHMQRAHGMAMITRKMFFKNLPTMPDVEAVKNARIVMKSEMNQFTSPLMPFTLEEIKARQLKKAKMKM